MKACLTTCVNYGDILYYTLPRMLENFDRTLVVTSPEDAETKQIVDNYGGELHSTDAFHLDGAPFNKARAIRRGIEHLDLDRADWLAFVDADVFLPSHIASHLESLDRGTLYGCTRVMCETPEAWQQFLQDGNTDRFLRDNPQRMGVVLGYFQFFSMHKFAAIFQWGYPVRPDRKTAMRADLDFAWAWEKHEWLPFECIHLGPEEINWEGRRSERFRARDYQETS